MRDNFHRSLTKLPTKERAVFHRSDVESSRSRINGDALGINEVTWEGVDDHIALAGMLLSAPNGRDSNAGGQDAQSARLEPQHGLLLLRHLVFIMGDAE
jgi:hypothetical protein